MFVSNIIWYSWVSIYTIFGCALGSMILTPFRRVQILIQTKEELVKQGILITPYFGIRDCVKRIIKTEGYRGLWKSFSICFLRLFFGGTIVYPIISFLKSRYFKVDPKSYLLDFVSQMIEYLVSDLSLQPLENIEVLISSDVAYGSLTRPKYHGIFDFTKKFREANKNYRKLYNGFSIMITGQFLPRILSDITSVIFSRIFGKERKTFLAELLPMAYSILLSCPFEILRRRNVVNDGIYSSNIVKGFKTIIKEEGVFSLYGGVGYTTIFVIRFMIPIIIKLTLLSLKILMPDMKITYNSMEIILKQN